jgi:hypothetical protein
MPQAGDLQGEVTAVSPLDHSAMAATADSETASVSDGSTVSSTSSSRNALLSRQRFRKSAVLVENALLATRQSRSSGLRLGSERRPRGGTAGSHVAGSKSFAALGHAVVGFTRRGRGGGGHFTDTASNVPGSRQTAMTSKQSTVPENHALHCSGGVHAIGGDAVLVMADEDSTRSIDTTLVYGIVRPFFICMKIIGLFFIRRSSVPSDVDTIDQRQATNASSSGATCSRLRSILQTTVNRFWSPAQIFGVVITILLIFNFIRSLCSLQVGLYVHSEESEILLYLRSILPFFLYICIKCNIQKKYQSVSLARETVDPMQTGKQQND